MMMQFKAVPFPVTHSQATLHLLTCVGRLGELGWAVASQGLEGNMMVARRSGIFALWLGVSLHHLKVTPLCPPSPEQHSVVSKFKGCVPQEGGMGLDHPIPAVLVAGGKTRQKGTGWKYVLRSIYVCMGL